MSHYSQLEFKLEQYIRAYHSKELIRGAFIVFASAILSSLLLVGFEYYIGFTPFLKKILLASYSLAFFGLAIVYLALPLLALLNVYGRKNSFFYAELIGNQYQSIADKLINYIHLKQSDSELALLAAELKNVELAKIPFEKKVIRWNDFKIPGLFFFTSLVVIGSVSLLNPSILNTGGKQLLDVNTYYEYIPFEFSVNNNLSVERGTNLKLEIAIDGDYAPSVAYINWNGFQYKLKQNGSVYTYEIRNIQEGNSFTINADGYSSRQFMVSVLDKPILKEFYTEISYPEFTGLNDTVVKNTFEYALPIGSKLAFNFKTDYSDSIIFSGGPVRSSEQVVEVTESATFNVRFINKASELESDVQFKVVAIPDLGPTIKITEYYPDDSLATTCFFNGSITDNYRLQKVGFEVLQSEKTIFDSILAYPVGKSYVVNSAIDFQILKFKSSSVLRFYAIDNQGNISYSTPFEIDRFSKEALDNAKENLEKATSGNFNSIKSQNKEIQKSFSSLNQSLKNNSVEQWQLKNEINSIESQLQQLINALTESKENLLKKNALDNNSDSEKRLEKQNQINELLDQLLTEELKDLLKEMQSLQDSLNKDKLNDLLKDSEFPLDNIDKQLDEVLDYLKELQFTDDIEKLANDVKKAEKELENGNLDNIDDLQQQAEKLEKDAQDLDKEEFGNLNIEERLEELNKELKKESSNGDNKQSNDSSSDSKNGKEKKQQRQKQQQKLKDIANDLESFNQQQQEEQNGEDAEAIRQLLDNLVELSFRQEDVVNELKQTSFKDPRLNEILKNQKSIESDFLMIEDSLNALAVRVSHAAPSINKAVYNFRFNVKEGIFLVADNKLFEGNAKFQYSLTELNNLAAMFEESLQNMQSSMQMKGNSNKECKNPKSSGKGKGSKPSQSMSEMQKSLQKQLDDMKKGKTPSGKEKGNKPGMQLGGLSGEQFAKIAAEQALLKQMLQELRMSKNGQNSQVDKLLDDIDRLMGKNLQDLYNKKFGSDLISRTEEIKVKMLESEKALKEQEEENRRESTENNVDYTNSNDTFEEYFKSIRKELEELENSPVNFEYYYGIRVGEYFNKDN